MKGSEPQWTNSPNTARVCYIVFETQVKRATKLPVLFQPYLLQIMYMPFEYLTVSSTYLL